MLPKQAGNYFLTLQISLEELLALSSALESSSEHPLARAVLDFAESIISPAELQSSRCLGRDTEAMEVSTSDISSSRVEETEMLLMSSRSPNTNSSPSKAQRRTDWLRTAKDVESKPGEQSCLCQRTRP